MYSRPSAGDQLQTLAHALGVVALAFAAGIGLGLPATVGMALLGFSISPPSLWVQAVGAVLQYVGFLAVVVGYLAYRDVEGLVRVRLPTVRDLGWMVAGLLGLFAGVYLVAIAITVIGADQAQNTVVTQGRQNPDLFLVMIPITVLFVATGEELVFRGVVQGLFRRAYGAVPAVLLASVLFGVAHYAALTGSGKLTYIAVTILLGLVLGGIYELSDNVVVPIVVHGAYNAILFASQWVAAVDGVPVPT